MDDDIEFLEGDPPDNTEGLSTALENLIEDPSLRKHIGALADEEASEREFDAALAAEMFGGIRLLIMASLALDGAQSLLAENLRDEHLRDLDYARRIIKDLCEEFGESEDED